MWGINLVMTLISQAVILYVTDCSAFLIVRSTGRRKTEYICFALLFGLTTAVLWYNLDVGNTLLLSLITLLLVVSTVVSGINVNGGVNIGRGKG